MELTSMDLLLNTQLRMQTGIQSQEQVGFPQPPLNLFETSVPSKSFFLILCKNLLLIYSNGYAFLQIKKCQTLKTLKLYSRLITEVGCSFIFFGVYMCLNCFEVMWHICLVHVVVFIYSTMIYSQLLRCLNLPTPPFNFHILSLDLAKLPTLWTKLKQAFQIHQTQ